MLSDIRRSHQIVPGFDSQKFYLLSKLKNTRIFILHKTLSPSDIENAMLIRKLLFVSKVDWVGDLKCNIFQGGKDIVGSTGIDSKVVPGVTLPWKNTVSTELEGLLSVSFFVDIVLHQEGATSDAAHIRNSDDILFDDVVLALLLYRPLLTVLLGGANEIGLKGLIII